MVLAPFHIAWDPTPYGLLELANTPTPAFVLSWENPKTPAPLGAKESPSTPTASAPLAVLVARPTTASASTPAACPETATPYVAPLTFAKIAGMSVLLLLVVTTPEPAPDCVTLTTCVLLLALKTPVCPVIEPVALMFPVSLTLPVRVWLPVKALPPLSCGTLVVSRFKVRLPPTPPPVRSVPAFTLVTTLVVSTFKVKLPPVPPPVRSVPAATPVTTFVVSTFRVTLPLVPPPVRSVPAVTPVMVPSPVPGKVCPLAKVICPLLAMLSPVSAGFPVPCANKRLSEPLALLVSLLTASACHRKVCVTAVLVPLLNAEAARSRACELNPLVV